MRLVRAVDFDDYAGVRLVDETKARGDAVGLDAGDWLLYRDAVVGGGKRTFTAQVARAAAGGTTLQVRLDDPVTGPLVGTVQVPSTGGVYSYTTVRAAVTGGCRSPRRLPGAHRRPAGEPLLDQMTRERGAELIGGSPGRPSCSQLVRRSHASLVA